MRSRSGLQSARTEDGFTLVELLIAIVIMGVITVPLSGVVIGYLHNTDATTARLLASHDVQIASAYWSQDVASIGHRDTTYTLIQSVETNVEYNSGLYPCGPTGTPNAAVRLAWDDFSGPGPATVIRVAYVVKNTTELHRLRCDGSATVVSDVTLAHNLAGPPTVACLPTSLAGCAAAPAVPTKITLNLRLTDPSSPGSQYSVPLTGQRRQSS